MKKILSLIFVFGLLGCSKTNRQSERTTSDSPSPDNVSVNDYESALMYRKLDSDSLLIDRHEFARFVSFRTKGNKIKEKDYEGGDCGGKFIQIVLTTDTLTIDKYDCGDYGFGNTEFIMEGDSLRYVREYKMEWSQDGKGNEFTVTENIYEFSDVVTKRTRTKSTKGWRDFKISDSPFQETKIIGRTEYIESMKALRELALIETLDE